MMLMTVFLWLTPTMPGRTGVLRLWLSALLLVGTVVFSVVTANTAQAQRTVSDEVMKAYGQKSCSWEVTSHQPDENRKAAKKAISCVRGLLAENRTAAQRAALLHFAAQLEVELENFRQAIKDIEASFETGTLTDEEKAENHFFLGRLYLGLEPPDYDSAIKNLRKFIEMVGDPDADAHFYLAQALAMKGRFHKAIPHTQKAIELSGKAEENHYRLLLFCYSELKDYKRLAPLVERMLTIFPTRDEYLAALAGGYLKLNREEDAFPVLVFRYELGYLDSEEDLVTLADLYLWRDEPHEAARIMVEGTNNGRIRRTPENLAKLDRMLKAAGLDSDAQQAPYRKCPFKYCAPPLFPAEVEWSETGLRKAIDAGSLKEPCRARLLLGRIYLQRDDKKEALTEFRRAAESEACAEEAGNWITYLKGEKR